MKDQGQGAARQIEKPDASLRDFISKAVHDLREPLRAIRLGSQLLAAHDRDDNGESAAEGARFVTNGIDRMETLIRDIAEYCYEEVREPDSRETDLENVLSAVQGELAGELKAAGAVISHDPLPTVMGNSASLEAVFRCFIGNACKFRREAAPRIHIAAFQEAGEWILSVQDNGQGFRPAYREQIFRPFARLHGKEYPGSGLGLALAKRVIERHGGRIWAESNPGAGSTFWFSLPVMR